MTRKVLLLLSLLLMVALPLARAWAQNCDDDYDPDQTREEISLGRAASKSFESQYHIESSGPAYDHCEKIFKRLVLVAGRKLPFRLRIVDAPDVNAVTFPGGFIYVYRGLVEQHFDDNEIACVLGHELTHAVRAHGYRTMLVMQGLGRLSGSDTASAIGQIIMVMGVGRHYEYEADRLGMHIAAKAGYDPRGMLHAMEALNRLSHENPGLVGRLLATHPPFPDRIQHIKVELKAMGKL